MGDEDETHSFCTVECPCGAEIAVRGTKAEAITAWNTRPPNSLQAEVDALRDKVAEFEAAGCMLNKAIERARQMVPDDDEGLAANIFAQHINAAQMNYNRAALATKDTPSHDV